MIDQVIGNFRVLSLLGSGGMGDVYLAEHQGIQTRVAIKMLHPQISRDADHVQRFFNEARIVGKIKHAGIVKIFDVGFHDGRAYLVMELLDGESLASRVQRGRMPITETVDVAYQISSILAATHNAGIVHRDLKPDNIYLVPDDELGRPRVKILDFGIAKLGGTLSGGPKTIGTMGTPAYMAPEQWGDAGSVDWRADIYSLGCVVFEMLTGRPPFAASTITEAFRNHTQAPPPSARTIVDVPVAFDELVMRLLAKHAAARADSTAAVAHAFDALRVSIDPDAQWTTATQPHAIGRAATTLGASASQVVVAAGKPRRKWVLAGVFAALVVVVTATTIAVRGSGSDHVAATAEPPPPPKTGTDPMPVTSPKTGTDPMPITSASQKPGTDPTPPSAPQNKGTDPTPPSPSESRTAPPKTGTDPTPPARAVRKAKPVPAKAPPTLAPPPTAPPPPKPAPKSELEDRT